MANTILPTVEDDDAVSAFTGLVNDTSEAEVENQFNRLLEIDADGEQNEDVVDDGSPIAAEEVNESKGVATEGKPPTPEDEGGVGAAIKSTVTDILGGSIEAAPQAFGGVVDALDEVSKVMESILPAGSIQITDPETGEFDLKYLDPEASKERDAKAEDDLFEILSTDDASTVTGGLVRSTAQFLTAFVPALKGMKAVGLARGGSTLFAGEMAAGAIADAIAFDPFEDRLSTYLNTVPGLSAIVPDYLADTSPDNQTEWEGRLKNAIEGAGLGLAAEGLIRVFKYYKAQRQDGGGKREPRGAAEAEARDALVKSHEGQLVQEVDDAAVAPLGDPDSEDLFVYGSEDETLTKAMTRLGAVKSRVEQSNVATAALQKISTIAEKFKARTPKDVDPIDELIEAVRTGGAKGAPPSGGKRPMSAAVKSMGGVDPKSSLAAELRGRGITAKTHPGLFKKGGVRALDNIPASDVPAFEGRGYDDGNGYIQEQGWIDALESEAGGNPFRTMDEISEADQYWTPIEQFQEQMENLGINIDELSNADIKARIAQIADDEAAFARSREAAPDDASARDLEDTLNEGELSSEADRIADATRGIDPQSNAQQGKVFVNHARIKEPGDVKNLIQTMADLDADAINAKRGGEKVTNKDMIKASSKEFTELSDLIGRDPGPMTAPQAIAARRILNASGEQLMGLAQSAADAAATTADLFNFRRAMIVHYAIQAEVIAARTETARALQSWSIFTGSNKSSQGMVCAL